MGTASNTPKGDSASAEGSGNGRMTLGAFLKELRATPEEQCPEGGWPLLPPEAFRATPGFLERLYK
jgi:hypothetical protein